MKADDKTERGFRAVPVLTFAHKQKYRLGSILRQIRGMILQPALYLEDFDLGGHLFSAQEKTLTAEDGTVVQLTDRETDILAYLAKRGSVGGGRDDLLKNVWRYGEGVDTHTLETHIYRLRQKLKELPDGLDIDMMDNNVYALREKRNTP